MPDAHAKQEIMMIQKLFAIAAGTLVLASLSAPAPSQTLPIEWTISPARSEPGSRVQLALGYRIDGSHSMNSQSYPLERLRGLTAAQLSSTQAAPAAFSIGGEAGSIDCRGFVHQWRGTGECDFRPNQAFAAALESRGIGRPSLREQYQLSIADAGMPLIQELERQGYARPSIKDLVSASIHGVTIPYIRAMADSGYRLGNVRDLVKFRIHGVSSDYIREMGILNPPGGRFSPEELVRMRIHGLSAAKVRDYAAMGYRNLSAAQLQKMSIHGVTPAFIRGMAEAGYRNLSSEELVKMKIHGVDPDYIRKMRAAGYALPSADQLVRMRISGFRPDRRK